MIIAVDPGREKCGIAVLRENGEVKEHSVIATVWPFSLSILRILRFWSGVTRPNTVYVRTASSNFSSGTKARLTDLSEFGMPA